MKILLAIVVVQSFNLAIFAWFNRAAWFRILALRQQLAVYKRKSKKPMLRNGDRLFWSLLSKVWKDWKGDTHSVWRTQRGGARRAADRDASPGVSRPNADLE